MIINRFSFSPFEADRIHLTCRYFVHIKGGDWDDRKCKWVNGRESGQIIRAGFEICIRSAKGESPGGRSFAILQLDFPLLLFRFPRLTVRVGFVVYCFSPPFEVNKSNFLSVHHQESHQFLFVCCLRVASSFCFRLSAFPYIKYRFDVCCFFIIFEDAPTKRVTSLVEEYFMLLVRGACKQPVTAPGAPVWLRCYLVRLCFDVCEDIFFAGLCGMGR